MNGPVKNNSVKLYINNKPFYECQKNDEMCISNIYIGSKYGFPIDQSNDGTLYGERFNEPIKNKKIISCPDGYNVCDVNLCCSSNEKCIPPEHSVILGSQYSYCDFGDNITNLYVDGSPYLGQFRTEKQCLDWCAKNPDCKAMLKYLDREGNLECRYYKYDTNDNRMKMIEDKTAKIYNRRKYTYIPNPSKKILPKYDFNDTKKYNNLVGKCYPYGCCADGIKKANKDGSNCVPFTEKSKLIGDPYNLYKYSSLGGTTKGGTIDSLSGNAYINYF